MNPTLPPSDEARRIEALHLYAVLDTPSEQALDDLTTLAAQICGTPIALISLVDEHRQWFKAKVGLEAAETSRDISFCAHALSQTDLLIVPDATQDERFAQYSNVIGESGIRFYAGAPLITPDGAVLGTLCVIDQVARTLTKTQEQTLRVLARQVMTHLELRLSYERFQLVARATNDAVWDWNLETNAVWRNEGYKKLFGHLPEKTSTVASWTEFLHPEDKDRVLQHIHEAVNGGGHSWSDEYRFRRSDGTYADILDRGYIIHDARCKPVRMLGAMQDITERKRAEDLLHASEESYRSMFQANPLPMFVYDLETFRFLAVNLTAIQAYGYSEAEFLAMTIMDIRPAEDLPRLEQALKALQSAKKTFGMWRHQKKNGEIIDVEISSDSIVMRGRNARLVLANDITMRKRAEKELILLNACISKLNDAVIITEAEPLDEPGPKIVFANKAFERITGYLLDETLGRTPRLFQGPKTDRQTLKEIRQALEQHVPIRTEIINHRKDGTEYWLDIDIVPIFDSTGKCTHFVAIQRDITKEKKAEEQIAEQAAIMDKARDAILVRDLEGNVLYWNKGAERLYGWSRQEVIGRNICQLMYVNPSRFEEVKSMTISQGEWSGEVQHLTKDGRVLAVDTSWTLIRDHTGQPKSMLAINTDITATKKIEAQFMRAQRMESIGTLAGGVAHDLNNILAPILMSIDILKLSATDPQAHIILETIEVSAKRGADIVRQVLSFARGMEGERIAVQPKNLLKDIEAIIKDTFPKNIRLDFLFPEESWTILGDPTQLHQILLNLCVNARDAMLNGGSLIVTAENILLDEQYTAMQVQTKAGRYVCFNVTDSGIGIPPTILDRIFDPFFTTKEVGKGTGLGLSTAIAIVKSHGGFINVYSELGKGATFKVYLPAMGAIPEAQNAKAELRKVPRGNGETILIVDDEASIRTITSQTLQAFGYQVLTAIDGAEAVGIYAQCQDKISVILTDMAMPVMDGTATVRALRKINPTIKIIAASGLNSNGGVSKVASLNVNQFLAKPYTAETLLMTIRAVLDEA